jgi:hypothetical protein
MRNVPAIANATARHATPAHPRASASVFRIGNPQAEANDRKAVIFILEVEARPMRAREIWAAIEDAGLYTRSKGKTPWAMIGAKLATEPERFERVAPGLYQLRVAA